MLSEKRASSSVGTEERFHHQVRVDRAALRLDDDAHVLRTLVAHVADERQLAVLDQPGDLLDQPALLHLIGNLGDDGGPCAAAEILRLPARADADAATPCLVGLGERCAVGDDNAAGREVRTGHELHQLGERRVREFYEMQRRVAELGRIVRRDVGRHADGDAGRAVGEKVREGARQHHRLLPLPVIGRAEIDGVLVDAAQEQLGDHRHARFRVTHGRRVIAVDVAEIALPVDERIADGEILREADERVVDRLVAVWMEIAHHLADHLGGFLVTAGRVEAHLAHRIDDAPVHRLQPVAHVGERAVHDGGERVGEIALLERRPKVDRDDLAAVAAVAAFRRNHSFSHAP